MHYHIIMTVRCNSNCTYCYKKSWDEPDDALEGKFTFDFSAPCSFSVELDKLKKFIAQDKNAAIIFYGGEPLMETEKIMQVMDNINVPFRMQTNGKLLDKLPIEYVKRIGKILISIDGTKERTDKNRGNGTYDKVMENIKIIRNKGYDGELIARMTISQETPDVFEQVMHLLKTGFNSIHWQIDCGFYKGDYNEEKFRKFVKEYNESISKLINYWIDEMGKGKILRLYPFIAIIDSLLKNEKTKLRCGAGHSGYAIGTDGKIYACPIMNSIQDFAAGTIDDLPTKLKRFEIGGDCINCEIKNLCGGRCMYWNKSQLWPKTGNKLICDTIKHYINELQKILPEIKKLIEKGTIKKEDFEHEKYFGPEIIP